MLEHLRVNCIFYLISCLMFGVGMQPVMAQEYVYDPLDFTEPLAVARGRINPASTEAIYLNEQDRCHFVTVEWGWGESECQYIDQLIFFPLAGVDNVLIENPNSEGYVTFEDWESGDRDEQIEDIWENLKTAFQAQGERLGIDVRVGNWLVYPTLDRKNHSMYYAFQSLWDGEPTLNINMSKFDRYGYVEIKFVTDETSLTASEIENYAHSVLAMYQPNKDQHYAAFQNGDKVAAAGALGVLAAMAGVKYAKPAAAGIIAIALAFFKKAWFLLFLPFIWLRKKLFSKEDNKGEE